MAERQLTYLHNLDYHIGNLLQLPLNKITWSTSERDVIMQAVSELANDLHEASAYNSEKHQLQLKNITDLFWEDNEEITKNNEIHPTQFPPELIILYELVTIYNLVDSFYNPEDTKASHQQNK